MLSRTVEYDEFVENWRVLEFDEFVGNWRALEVDVLVAKVSYRTIWKIRTELSEGGGAERAETGRSSQAAAVKGAEEGGEQGQRSIKKSNFRLARGLFLTRQRKQGLGLRLRLRLG